MLYRETKLVQHLNFIQIKKGTEALSRSIQLDAMLSGAEFNVNPDDAQSVEITFKPTEAPLFDFSTSS